MNRKPKYIADSASTSQPEPLKVRPDRITIPFGMVARPALFQTGQVVHTPGFAGLFAFDRILTYVATTKLVTLHTHADWSGLEDDDKQRNQLAISSGDERIFGAFKLADEQQPGQTVTVWCITEADRSSTTLLLPDEY